MTVLPNPAPQNNPSTQKKIDVDDVVFIVNFNFTGTQTIEEIYENFLARKLKNSA